MWVPEGGTRDFCRCVCGAIRRDGRWHENPANKSMRIRTAEGHTLPDRVPLSEAEGRRQTQEFLRKLLDARNQVHNMN